MTQNSYSALGLQQQGKKKKKKAQIPSHLFVLFWVYFIPKMFLGSMSHSG